MFEKHFKLADQPFGATPDPHFLLRTESHREALASLYAGFYANRGFTVLIAEPGMGKTTLLFEFLNHIRCRARTVLLFDTMAKPDDVLSLILQDLGLEPSESAAERHRQLKDLLVAEARVDRKVVVVIDEAQNLSLEALEAVRLLSNFETSRAKLMQVVLSGQPQLADKLSRPEAMQLRQRVSTICRLTPFTAAETKAYIQHRLKLAGQGGARIFSVRAVELLVEASGGIPRVINTLCFNSLCLCVASNKTLVDEPTVLEAISDLELPISASTNSTGTKGGIPARSFGRNPTSSASQSWSVRTVFSFIAAAVLTLCMSMIRVNWRANSGIGHRSHSAFAAVLHIPDAASTAEANKGANPEPLFVHTASIAPAQKESSLMKSAKAEAIMRPKQIVVAPGQTLETIARTQLGGYDGRILREIQALNGYITDPNHITIGSTIRLPKLSETEKPDVPVRSRL